MGDGGPARRRPFRHPKGQPFRNDRGVEVRESGFSLPLARQDGRLRGEHCDFTICRHPHLKTAKLSRRGIPAAARPRRAPVRFFFKGAWPCPRWRTTEARPFLAPGPSPKPRGKGKSPTPCSARTAARRTPTAPDSVSNAEAGCPIRRRQWMLPSGQRRVPRTFRNRPLLDLPFPRPVRVAEASLKSIRRSPGKPSSAPVAGRRFWFRLRPLRPQSSFAPRMTPLPSRLPSTASSRCSMTRTESA